MLTGDSRLDDLNAEIDRLRATPVTAEVSSTTLAQALADAESRKAQHLAATQATAREEWMKDFLKSLP